MISMPISKLIVQKANKTKNKHKQTNFSSLIYVVHFLLFFFFCCLYTELWKFTCTPIAVERQLLKTSIEQFMFLYALFSCLVSFVFVDISIVFVILFFFSLSLSCFRYECACVLSLYNLLCEMTGCLN